MISGLNSCSPFCKTCCSEDVSTHLKMCLPQLRCVYRRPSAAPAFVPALATEESTKKGERKRGEGRRKQDARNKKKEEGAKRQEEGGGEEDEDEKQMI